MLFLLNFYIVINDKYKGINADCEKAIQEIKEKDKNDGDALFWSIVNCLSPKSENAYQITVIIIMSKYFETCDIFEELLKEGSMSSQGTQGRIKWKTALKQKY